MSLLQIRDLGVAYGPLQAVRGVSLEVNEGQTVALLGANGAGKSSTLRAIAGLVTMTGSIQFGGREVRRIAAHRRPGLGLVAVPEGRELFRSLSIAENLRMGAYRRRDGDGIARDLSWIYDLFPALALKRGAVAGSLSGGQAQMLAIGRALMANPSVLLMDEPSLGLAPNLVDEVFRLIPRLRAERSLSVLLVEQNANKALEVSSYAYVLEAGAIALEGPTEELARDARVRALYLGG